MTAAPAWEVIGDRLRAGAPLSESDAAALARTSDVVRLGALADERRRARRGGRATFVRVLEVPAAAADEAIVPDQAGELRLAGCPDTPDRVVDAVRAAARAAGGVPVTGFALDELVDLCGGDAARFDGLFGALRAEGLARIAEARVERTADPAWIARAAEAGVPVARCTVDRRAAGGLAALRRVAGWGSGAAVPVFAPLSRIVSDPPSTGYEDVRQVALARLLVDNIESIQVDWRLYGPQLAQVALACGADDVDGVSASDASEHGRRRAPLAEITRNIRAAGLAPVERDGRFRTLRTHHA